MSGLPAPPDDHALVRRVLNGDKDAYRILYERYRDKVFATVLRIVGNREEAADVAQDVFVRVYRDLGGFRFGSKFSTWLYRIAVNFSINKVNEHERHGRAHRRIAQEGVTEGDPADIPTERIQSAVSRLNPKLRTVIVLRYTQNLSYEEIAEVLELSMGTVKSRLHLAHGALRDGLRDLSRPD